MRAKHHIAILFLLLLLVSGVAFVDRVFTSPPPEYHGKLMTLTTLIEVTTTDATLVLTELNDEIDSLISMSIVAKETNISLMWLFLIAGSVFWYVRESRRRRQGPGILHVSWQKATTSQ